MIFKENYITRNKKTISSRIITHEAFLSATVSYKRTLNFLSTKHVTLIRVKMNNTNTTIGMKSTITGRHGICPKKR